jgi:XXXCH domain-containing protein
MADKIEKDLDRLELAYYLESLAEQVRSGRLKAADREWTIPDSLPVKIRFKEKKGCIRTRISWKWSTIDDYEEKDREVVKTWKKTLKVNKKRLSKSFGKLKKDVSNDLIPDEKAMAVFMADNRKFAELTEPEWREAMDAYMDHLENLERAVKNRQLDVIKHELRDLGNQMKACHKEFK